MIRLAASVHCRRSRRGVGGVNIDMVDGIQSRRQLLLEAARDLAPQETKQLARAAGRVAELLGEARDMRAGCAGDLDRTERELERARELEAECRRRMGDEMERRMKGIGRGGPDVVIGDSAYGLAFPPDGMDGKAGGAKGDRGGRRA